LAWIGSTTHWNPTLISHPFSAFSSVIPSQMYGSKLQNKKVRLVLTLHLEEFCQPGYELANEMDIGDAGDFPADIILRPEYGFPEPDMEPDEGPLVEQFENASRLGDDDWLEAAFEDRISGCGEE
jgi:hypothetical protein